MQKNNLPILLLECANGHGGNKFTLIKTIKNFSKNNFKNLHIKFQPFKFDNLACKNYRWYNVYKKLFFDEKHWKKTIQLAKKHYQGVWLDLSDNYSLKILKSNINDIFGIKLQSSTLNNQIIFENLKKIDLKQIQLIINVSGYDLNQIKNFYHKFLKLKCKNIIVQIGFQAYPTKTKDSNVEKINLIKKKLKNVAISFADHLDSNNSYALFLPIIAYLFGAQIIEKHVALFGSKAKYDGFSSLNYEQFNQMCENFNNFKLSYKSSFKISRDEKKYLKSSIQKVVVNRCIKKGSLVSSSDIDFKRS
jgi:N,N'-diacetyllegionaminate synthase